MSRLCTYGVQIELARRTYACASIIEVYRTHPHHSSVRPDKTCGSTVDTPEDRESKAIVDVTRIKINGGNIRNPNVSHDHCPCGGGHSPCRHMPRRHKKFVVTGRAARQSQIHGHSPPGEMSAIISDHSNKIGTDSKMAVEVI